MNTLASGASLKPGEALVSPKRGAFRLVHQSDGNVVLYAGASHYHPLWSSGTAGRASARLTMQGDGNLVLYDAQNRALWASGPRVAGSRAVMQDDANFVVYGPDGRAVWAAGTALNELGHHFL